MKSTELQPIIEEPALYLQKQKLLVVADLHIGIERQLHENGVRMPSQTGMMERRLISILQTHEIKDTILLGDIKHNIPTSTIQERSDVIRFLDTLQEYCTLHVLPGNHDGNIHRLLGPDIQLHPSNGFIFHDIGFTHGHRWPSQDVMSCVHVVIGHSHPTVLLIDRLGYRSFEQCWLRSNTFSEKLKEKYPESTTSQIILMPAFNPLCGGVAVNQDQLLGPFGSLINIDTAELYLLDGSCLGMVKDVSESVDDQIIF